MTMWADAWRALAVDMIVSGVLVRALACEPRRTASESVPPKTEALPTAVNLCLQSRLMTRARSFSAERAVLTALGVGRIVWNATAALAPAQVHRALGTDYPGPDQGIWIRAFGVRGVVLGVGALHPDQTIRSAVLRAGIVVDLVDAGIVVAAARNGVPRRASGIGILLAGGTAVFAAAGPPVLRRTGWLD